MNEQIHRLNKVYHEFSMAFTPDFPGMIDLKKTIEELKYIDTKDEPLLKFQKHTNINCPVCLENTTKNNITKNQLLEKILQIIASEFETSSDAIKSRINKKELIPPRWLMMYIMVRELRCSAKFTGEYLKKNHSSVLYCLKHFQELIEKNDNKFCDRKKAVYEKAKELIQTIDN